MASAKFQHLSCSSSSCACALGSVTLQSGTIYAPSIFSLATACARCSEQHGSAALTYRVLHERSHGLDTDLTESPVSLDGLILLVCNSGSGLCSVNPGGLIKRESKLVTHLAAVQRTTKQYLRKLAARIQGGSPNIPIDLVDVAELDAAGTDAVHIRRVEVQSTILRSDE
ncbi:hypothetical protein FHL15_002550 [Xylaria flabelliformis]|uniref:Uncharacterized protein n=1 Tax=Xylaria flabelliformis TaxID=2512241 RepID=A0A553I8W2_9PEZI|nr:hypothetical protein FHL15_002550 [Xylaria flabelliformis]